MNLSSIARVSGLYLDYVSGVASRVMNREAFQLDKRMMEGYRRFIKQGLGHNFPEGYFDRPEIVSIIDNFIKRLTGTRSEGLGTVSDDLTKKIKNRLNKEYGMKDYILFKDGKKVDKITAPQAYDDEEIRELFKDKGHEDIASGNYKIDTKPSKEVIQGGEIQWDDEELARIQEEALGEIISDMLEDPLSMERALLEMKLSPDETKDIGVLDTYFYPRLDLDRVGQLKKERGEEYPAEVGKLDTDLMREIAKRKDLKWRYVDLKLGQTRGGKPISKLRFSLPELTGDREYEVIVPGQLKDVRGGDHTFEVKEADPTKKKGAILGFKDQSDKRVQGTLDAIETEGLLPDQFKKFLNQKLYDQFMGRIESWPMDKLFDRFLGGMYIGSKRVTSKDELDKIMEDREQVKMTKKPLEQHFEEEAQMEQEIRNVLTRDDPSSPYFAQHVFEFLSQADRSDETLINKIVSGFEPASQAKSVSGLLRSQEMARHVLDLIMSRDELAEAGKLDTWVPWVQEELKRGTLYRDPKMAPFFKGMVEVLKKEGVTVAPGDEPKTITDYFTHMNKGNFQNQIKYLKQDITDSIMGLAARKDPAMDRLLGKTKGMHRELVERMSSLNSLLWDQEFDKASAILNTIEDPKIKQQVFTKLEGLKKTDYENKRQDADSRIAFIIQKFQEAGQKAFKTKTASVVFDLLSTPIDTQEDYSHIVHAVALLKHF